MSIPRDVGFGLDSFQRPKVLNEAESVAQYILNILIWKPGNLPGLPHIGIDIKNLLYTYVDDFQPEILRTKIYEQCNELLPHVISSSIVLAPVEHEGKEFFIIIIPVILSDRTEHNISYAFYNDSSNQFAYGYEIDQL